MQLAAESGSHYVPFSCCKPRKLNIADWDTLFKFHEEYQTSDSLSSMPHTLNTSDGCSWEMHGMPVPWSTL
eukprot:3269020-Pleurochrysis_carterae.AAC.1